MWASSESEGRRLWQVSDLRYCKKRNRSHTQTPDKKNTTQQTPHD